MSRFRGLSNHTIDSKGRLIIPARFKELINDGGRSGVMVSKMDRCLVAYPFEEWEKIEVRILDMAERSDAMRRFRRIFIGGAFECICDKQDRILIPPSLREYAELKREISLVGVLDHFEIWARDHWDNEKALLDQDMQEEEFRNQISRLRL
jgi:MraZ protein